MFVGIKSQDLLLADRGTNNLSMVALQHQDHRSHILLIDNWVASFRILPKNFNIKTNMRLLQVKSRRNHERNHNLKLIESTLSNNLKLIHSSGKKHLITDIIKRLVDDLK